MQVRAHFQVRKLRHLLYSWSNLPFFFLGGKKQTALFAYFWVLVDADVKMPCVGAFTKCINTGRPEAKSLKAKSTFLRLTKTDFQPASYCNAQVTFLIRPSSAHVSVKDKHHPWNDHCRARRSDPVVNIPYLNCLIDGICRSRIARKEKKKKTTFNYYGVKDTKGRV